MQENFDLIVIGGGAAGFMGAITAADSGRLSVAILESSSKTLEKVRISGGGRCNITNGCWEPHDLVVNYPRGEKPLLGPFSNFATGDAFEWFSNKGLELIVEKDGRVFPKSNLSTDVINCLTSESLKYNIKCYTKMNVYKIRHSKTKGFIVYCKNTQLFYSKYILIATGGSNSGKIIANRLGHKIIRSVPSLFTFKINAKWLTSCSGISVNNVKLKLISSGKVFEEYGRILITHWGISGPAVLKLSAFAARHLHEEGYKFQLSIKWLEEEVDVINKKLKEHKINFANRSIGKSYPFIKLPKRLWISILSSLNINPDYKWSSLSKVNQQNLCATLTKNLHQVHGRGPYGEEFVTAGGIELEDINLRSMESRICEGLYFAGEVINIDGITGGFNFQHCWTSGWIAGKSIAKSNNRDNC